MTAPTDTRTRLVRVVPPPTLLRSGIALVLAAIVLWAALNFGLRSVVVVLFAGWSGLPFVIIAPTVAMILISIIVAVCTGRRNIPAAVTAAIVVTVIAFIALGVAFVRFRTVPMIWVEPGFELVPLLIAVPCALMLGLFLGRWKLRVVGMLGVALLVTGAVVVGGPNAGPADLSLEARLEAEAEQQAAEQEDANFESFIDSGDFPMVADVPNGRVVGVLPNGGPPQTLSVTADGGVVEVVIDRSPIASNPEITPCWYISGPDMGLEPTDTMEDYASWCAKEGELWRLTDGTGYARMEEGSLIAVSSATVDNVQVADGKRPANAEEILEAWNSLRLMTEAEVREHRE